MPIMITPVDPNGRPDLESLRRVVEFCMENGAVAIGAFGGVSEYQRISDYDREAILETIVDQTDRRVPVFVGVAAVSMRSTLHNAEQANRLGGDLLMVCSPDVGPMNRDALFDYYKAIAEASDLPVIVQDTGASARSYDAEFISRLYHEIETVRYGKIEGGAHFLVTMNRLKELVDDGFQMIGGGGGRHLILILRQGVTAIMAGTYFLDIYSHVIQTYLEGDTEQAVDFYNNTVGPFVMMASLGKRRIRKYVLKRRGIIDCDEPLFPYDEPPLDPLYIQELDWLLEKIERYAEERRLSGGSARPGGDQ